MLSPIETLYPRPSPLTLTYRPGSIPLGNGWSLPPSPRCEGAQLNGGGVGVSAPGPMSERSGEGHPSHPNHATEYGSDTDQRHPTNPALTVLLVEDERALREIVKRQLTRHGYRVITAGDGVEALALAVGQDVDLVITDVLMPNMKGNELATQLAAVCPTAKVIFMSGYTNFELDASDTASLLHKPFSEDALLKHISEALGTDVVPDLARSREPI